MAMPFVAKDEGSVTRGGSSYKVTYLEDYEVPLGSHRLVTRRQAK
jgi:hypothetical protein